MARKKKNEESTEEKKSGDIDLQEPKVSEVARLRALKSAQKARDHANKKQTD